MTKPTRFAEQVISTYLQTQPFQDFQNRLETPTTDWPAIRQLLNKHKLYPVFQKVLQGVPGKQNLRHTAQGNRIRLQQLKRSLFMRNELQKTIDAFANSGIRVTPYKGLVFAQLFYGDLSQRVSVDIDLAISLSDIPASFAIMRALGYVENSKYQQDVSTEQQALKKSRAYHIDYSWVLYKNGKIICNIEFHWQPAHAILQIPLSFEDLPETAFCTINLAGQNVPSFTKPYLALFTIIHHGLVDTWGKYRHLLDFAMILKGLNKTEYAALKALLKKYKIERCFYTGLFLLEQLFNFPVSDDDFHSDQFQKHGLQLLEAIQDDRLSGNWSENPRKLLFHLRMRDSWLHQLRTVASLIWFKLRFE